MYSVLPIFTASRPSYKHKVMAGGMQLLGFSGGANEIRSISCDRNIAAVRVGAVLPAVPRGKLADPPIAAVRHCFVHRPFADGSETGIRHSS